MAYAEIVFSDKQQLALLGYAITDQKVFESAADFGVSKDWFTNPNSVRVWSALSDFVSTMRHPPTLDELKSQPVFVREDPKIRDACMRTLDASIAARADIGYDGLLVVLREWSVARSMRSTIEKTVNLWNRGDMDLALESFKSGFIEIDRIDQKTTGARIQDSPTRVKTERAERLEQRSNILSYGVTFLDEATGGIRPNDLVLIGAKSGAGKTELVKRIADRNALDGKRVVIFSLESEINEIERRIKYGIIAKAYGIWLQKNATPSSRAINYRLWRDGALEKEVGQFEDGADRAMGAYKTLKTLYRQSGEYGISELERDITRVAPDTDLVIIDHLHYIDIEDGENENVGMKKIVKKLRDLALGLGKPIVAVAHLKKTQGGKKYAPLIAELEDFHGSSDIIKIATTAILLAPCYEARFVHPDQQAKMTDTWATYMRIPKFRIDGSLLRYAAVSWFDPTTGRYRNEYALGKLVSNDCHWDPIIQPGSSFKGPHWCKSGNILLRSTNE